MAVANEPSKDAKRHGKSIMIAQTGVPREGSLNSNHELVFT